MGATQLLVQVLMVHQILEAMLSVASLHLKKSCCLATFVVMHPGRLTHILLLLAGGLSSCASLSANVFA